MSGKQNTGHIAKNAGAKLNEIGTSKGKRCANVRTEPLVTVREASNQTGIPKGTIYHWLERRLIPKYCLGKTVRLRLSELWAYIESGRIEAL